MATVVVAGAVANKPASGGEAWVRLSWVGGLVRLGLDVYFLEEIAPATCVSERGEPAPFEDSANLAYFRGVVGGFGLAGRAALVYDAGAKIDGLSRDSLLDIARDADLLVNISGHLRWPQLLARFRRKAYIDIDPGYTQLWYAAGNPGAALEGHDAFFTIGENLGTPACPIPLGDIPWQTTRQPVVLDDWPVTPTADGQRFTTVGTWRGPYGSAELDGQTYGSKVHEFRKVIELPRLVPYAFELALDIHPGDQADLALLRRNDWRIVDPREAAGDPESFRRYVQGSGAEFSVAQGVYVGANTGWFSDRTARYLASGKPALVQQTGFDRHLPVGEGLVGFATPDDAVAGAQAIQRDYEHHARAARAVAEEHFDSDVILASFLERALP